MKLTSSGATGPKKTKSSAKVRSVLLCPRDNARDTLRYRYYGATNFTLQLSAPPSSVAFEPTGEIKPTPNRALPTPLGFHELARPPPRPLLASI
jgi:hypothetical protein